MQGDTEILRELYMLTGRVDRDKNYLYYLLVKDGSFFEENKPVQEVKHDKSSVESFEDWFDNL